MKTTATTKANPIRQKKRNVAAVQKSLQLDAGGRKRNGTGIVTGKGNGVGNRTPQWAIATDVTMPVGGWDIIRQAQLAATLQALAAAALRSWDATRRAPQLPMHWTDCAPILVQWGVTTSPWYAALEAVGGNQKMLVRNKSTRYVDPMENDIS